MIAANNGHVLAFDNLSGLPGWLSDALCRLASGGSFALRQLYTDDEEVLFQAARPILERHRGRHQSRRIWRDRAIFLTLDSDSETRNDVRKQSFGTQFEIARPRILGALLDAVVHGLRDASSHSARSAAAHGRFRAMGNGLRNSALACRALFARPTTQTVGAAIESVIDADPVATFVREIMAERTTWVGKASDLLQARWGEKNSPSRMTAWPTNPRALAARLRRCQTFLRTTGIEIAFSREGRAGSRTIRMTSLAKSRAAATASTEGNGSEV